MKSYHLLPVLLFIIVLLTQCTKEELDTSPAENLMIEANKIYFTYPASKAKPVPKPGIFTAAEWNDLVNWHLWIPQLKKGPGRLVQEKWNFALQHRYTLVLTDSLHKRIPDAKIILETTQGTLLDESRTDNTGICYLYPTTIAKSEDLRLKIVYADQVFYIGDLNPKQGIIEKQLNIQRKASPVLDVLLMASANHAAGNELPYLQKELKQMLNKVKNQSVPELAIRLGSVVYGDYTGKSVIHNSPFTIHTSLTSSSPKKPYTASIADSLTIIDFALEEAVFRQNWSKEAISRILFLFLDTPIFHDLGTINRVNRVSREAARQGIRIIPVVTGHMNLSGELLLRSIAIRTNGTYVFITHHPENGASPAISTIGTYTEEPFNNLMLKLLVKYSRIK